MRTPLIAGNWKMHGSSAFVAEFAGRFTAQPRAPGVEVLLLPPAPYLQELAEALAGRGVAVGVQNVHDRPDGAFTGELSAEMARDIGATWTLVGHSERRLSCGETDEVVAAKLLAALRAHLQPILCVGETLAERDSGSAVAVVERQIASAAAACGAAMTRVTVAYEPVWAIGSGRTATPVQAQDMHAAIRVRLGRACGSAADAMRILYGGSVKPDNAATLLAEVDIDGALVGGASLQPDGFAAIVAAAADVAADPSSGDRN